MLFQSELGWSVLNCWAGPLALGIGLLCKNKKQKGLAGARPLPLRCLSQFFPLEENINCLGNEVLCICLPTFHRWGDLVFIMGDFPSWMVIRTLSYGMIDFLSLSQSD